MKRSMPDVELAAQFAALAETYDENGGRVANSALNKLQAVRKVISASQDHGLAILERLLSHRNAMVRYFAAKDLLPLAEDKAMNELLSLAGQCLGGATSNAKLSIQRWRKEGWFKESPK